MSLKLISIALLTTSLAAPASASLIETYHYSIGGWDGTASRVVGFFSGTDLNGDGFLTIDAPDPASTASEVDYLSIGFPGSADFPALSLSSDLQFGVGYQFFPDFGDYALSFSYELGTSDGFSMDFTTFGMTEISVGIFSTGGVMSWIDYSGLPDVPDTIYRLSAAGVPSVSKVPLPASLALGGLGLGALGALRLRKS